MEYSEPLSKEEVISESQEFWKKSKNSLKGKRGFVIGNGPSLKMEHLDLIAKSGDVSIASNKIFMGFEKTDWRPNYHTVADVCLMEKIEGELQKHTEIIFVPDSSSQRFQGIKKYVWKDLGEVGKDPESPYNFSDDIAVGAFAGATITFFNLQMAVHLGLNPIYIIGCDHYYSDEENIIKDQKVSAPAKNNHFIEGYRKKGELVNPAPIDVMNKGYAHARIFSDSTDVKIFNATIGGHLESFERVDFFSLFN